MLVLHCFFVVVFWCKEKTKVCSYNFQILYTPVNYLRILNISFLPVILNHGNIALALLYKSTSLAGYMYVQEWHLFD